MRNLTLEKTVYLSSQLEPMPLPQVAMAGRSNVGKSSLINRLAGRKKLAKISSTPGKTRSLNFYKVIPGNFFLVDLPGYGYARVSKTERAKWGKLIEQYMLKNPWLKAVAVLLDSRHPPQKPDLELVAFLNKMHIPIIAVLTKADKPKQKDREQVRSQWAPFLHSKKPHITSAQSGAGIDALWTILEKAVAPTAATLEEK